MKCFMNFLALNNINPCGLLMPINEDILLLFVAHCYSVLQLKYATIKLSLSGVRFCYLQAGVSNPLWNANASLQRLYTILRSIKKVQGSSTLKRLPITFDILFSMCKELRKGIFSPFTDLMLETVFCTAFFAFLRCGEFTYKTCFNPEVNLSMGDVKFIEGNSIVQFTLKASKTDPFRQGVTVHLCTTGHEICPVSALIYYLNAIPQTNRFSNQPLFIDNNYRPLSRYMFTSFLRMVLQRLGLDSSCYLPHSFRAGASTTCSEVGIEDHLIRTLGRWISDSYIRYIRTPLSAISLAQRNLGRV